MIEIQRRIVARLRDEIEESIGRVSPTVQIYYDEYWKEFESFERISSKSELIAACAAAHIVYCGDYHTLRQSQSTARRLIEELHARRPKMVVALEMVAAHHQLVLDEYMCGQVGERQFLKAIDYGNTWDFPWEPYRQLLETCRRLKVHVVAINSDPKESSSHVLERDFNAAQVIAGQTAADPERLVFVLDGDLHVARDHLPLIVDSVLQSRGIERTHVVVHQNAEPIYWKLAEQGLDRVVDVARIAEDCYCIFSATPLVKLQSYLNWEQNHQELCSFVHPAWRFGEAEPDYTEQMHELVSTIAGFLEIDEAGLDDFSVYTTGDLDFLDILARDGRFKPRELAEIRRQIDRSESYFIPRANIIYLADLSLHCAAEEAAHFINTTCAGFEEAPRDRRDAFYFAALREAIGFFGSRIIDHKRYSMSEADFHEFLRANRRKRLDERGRELRALARLVLRHREAERAAVAGLSGKTRADDPRLPAPSGPSRPVRPGPHNGAPGAGTRAFRRLGAWFFRKPPATANALAHALGYILGDRLYAALLSGRIAKAEVRDLFYDPVPPGTAEARYLALVARLDGVEREEMPGAERF